MLESLSILSYEGEVGNPAFIRVICGFLTAD